MSREVAISLGIESTQSFNGEIWECGTFRGDMAAHMSGCAQDRTIRLFDTFNGQPYSGPHDIHKVGSMNGTSYQLVEERFESRPNIKIHSGIMPFTFSGLEDSVISVVNIDVDNHDSVRDCLTFVYPRVHPGGYIVLDDYGCPDCPGAKKATDEFLADKPERLVGHMNPQAYFVKI